MDFKTLLIIGAGIVLLFYFGRVSELIQFRHPQYYPKYMNDSEYNNYNFGGAGQ